jgi:hypothetical protein
LTEAVKGFVGDENYDSVYKHNSVPYGDYISYVYLYSIGGRVVFYTVLKVVLLAHWLYERQIFPRKKYPDEIPG